MSSAITARAPGRPIRHAYREMMIANIRRVIDAEDAEAPLTDGDITRELILASLPWRSVRYYRELGEIPSASERRRQ